MNKHRLHPQRIGHQTRVLPTGAAETLQCETGDIVPLLHRDLLDRIRHVGDGDLEKTLGDLSGGAYFAGCRRYPFGQRGEFFRDHRCVQRTVPIRPKNGGKMCWLDFAHADIGVRHGQRPAAPVARWPRIRPRRVRPHPHARAIEMQDGPATRRHGVDRHHRRPHPYPRDGGFERTLERAGIQRHVGGGAAHVEADDAVEPRHGRRTRRADDAAGRAGQDGVLALEGTCIGQSAVGLHEIEPRAAEFAGDPIHVAAQDRRQVGVHHRGVAAGHDPQQRADGVTGGNLGHTRLFRQRGQALLVIRVFPGIHQHNGAGVDALGFRGGEGFSGSILVERLDLGAIDTDTAGNFDHVFIQHRGEDNLQVEQAGPGLVADAQAVGEAGVHHQQGAFALTLQQRVGGDGGAHLHRVDLAGWDRGVERDAQDGLDPGDGGIAVAAGVFGQ